MTTKQQKQILLKYPRLVRALLNQSGDTDEAWAASVLINAKHEPFGLAHSLVSEAWTNRHQLNWRTTLPVFAGETYNELDVM